MKPTANKFALMFLLLASPAWSASAQERALLKFYNKNYKKIQSEYLREIVHSTEKYADRLCLTNQIDTLLSMAHRESEFNMFADDIDLTGINRHSVGIYQTRADYKKWLRLFWEYRGVNLGADDAVDTQCAFGVAEFYVHLGRSGGNVWGGVRRYNGSGAGARAYVAKVMISRRVIFGRAYFDGEAIKLDCQKQWRKK